MTVVWATQIVHMAEKLCDRIAIVDKGAIQACGTLDELRSRVGVPDAGLDRIFKGWARLGLRDEDILAKGFDCFDALYTCLKKR